jgi:phosphoribosyl-ATP pyrophosphohydrolase/phosphoribosyl-AMP cyclohydrolase/histidinol dehydrogenase
MPTVDPGFRSQVETLIEEVRRRGDEALREFGRRFDGLAPDHPLVLEPPALSAALQALPVADREVLQRTADRIRDFARLQREGLPDVEGPVPGGRAGHRWTPVERAGCYAPGGRYPLPSSVLMTAVPARVAGVASVVVATPRPSPVSLAAAAVAGADRVLAVGGAHAVAALAYGTDTLPAVDVVVGPGNRWVTAAKQLVSGRVGIDMLAGPSELLVVADGDADPALVAADLLAQAEHDVEARVGLISLSEELCGAVDAELQRQLARLRTAETAAAALRDWSFAAVAKGLDEAIATSDRLAPEHLQLHLSGASEVADRFRCFGGLFIGKRSAEVLGDYGIGPNHTLPTSGTGRFRGGLSVSDFLVARTWLRMDAGGEQAVRDAERLAELEGLDAHAKSAARRRGTSTP